MVNFAIREQAAQIEEAIYDGKEMRFNALWMLKKIGWSYKNNQKEICSRYIWLWIEQLLFVK